MINSSFNERLTELLIENNLTASALGEKIGVTGSAVHIWKKEGKSITLDNALKLTGYFKCSLDFLAGRSEKPLDYTPKNISSFYDSLAKYMKNADVSQYRVVKETKLSRGNFSSWKDGCSPSLQSLIILADYFETTIDCLLGIEN